MLVQLLVLVQVLVLVLLLVGVVIWALEVTPMLDEVEAEVVLVLVGGFRTPT